MQFLQFFFKINSRLKITNYLVRLINGYNDENKYNFLKQFYCTFSKFKFKYKEIKY